MPAGEPTTPQEIAEWDAKYAAKDEFELQGQLGRSLGKVKWNIGPKPDPNVHDGIIYQLHGGTEGDTVLVCSCGWAMRFDRTVRVKQAEETFVEHVDG